MLKKNGRQGAQMKIGRIMPERMKTIGTCHNQFCGARGSHILYHLIEYHSKPRLVPQETGRPAATAQNESCIGKLPAKMFVGLHNELRGV